MPPPRPDTSLSGLSVLDWIGVLGVAAAGLFALAVPLLLGPVFRRLAESLGATAPGFGSSLLQGWVPPLLGALPLVVLGIALGEPQSLARRRVLLGRAFALTVLASAVLLVTFYGALFAVAGTAAGP